jgi:hypothetical protein
VVTAGRASAVVRPGAAAWLSARCLAAAAPKRPGSTVRDLMSEAGVLAVVGDCVPTGPRPPLESSRSCRQVQARRLEDERARERCVLAVGRTTPSHCKPPTRPRGFEPLTFGSVDRAALGAKFGSSKPNFRLPGRQSVARNSESRPVRTGIDNWPCGLGRSLLVGELRPARAKSDDRLSSGAGVGPAPAEQTPSGAPGVWYSRLCCGRDESLQLARFAIQQR